MASKPSNSASERATTLNLPSWGFSSLAASQLLESTTQASILPKNRGRIQDEPRMVISTDPKKLEARPSRLSARSVSSQTRPMFDLVREATTIRLPRNPASGADPDTSLLSSKYGKAAN